MGATLFDKLKDSLLSKDAAAQARGSATRGHKIYFDARCLQDPHYKFRGVGRHSSNIVGGVKAARADVKLVACCDPDFDPMPAEYVALFDEVRNGFPRTLGENASVVCLSPMTHDLAFIPALKDSPKTLKSVLIYDFIPWDHPGYFNDSPGLDAYLKCLKSLRDFNIFFPISRYSADRLLQICEVKPESVHVTGVGINDEFFAAAALAAPDLSAIVDRFGLSLKSFVMFVGGGDPRKNATFVAELMGRHHASAADRVVLVIGGYYPHEMKRQLTRKYMDSGGFAGGLNFLPHVSDAELAALYHAALCTIVASLIEGFSLPVVEALAAGCPVLVSDCDAHKELVTTPDTVFGKSDVVDALHKLQAFIQFGESKVESLLKLQAADVEKYRCGSVRQRFSEPMLARVTAVRPVAPRSRTRPRVCFATPWPPARSGVATYSYNTLVALSAHADIDVFTTLDASSRRVPGIKLRSIDDPINRDDYDKSYFVIGNSFFHKPMIRELIDGGGVSIIHDSRMFEYYYFDHSGRDGKEFQAMATKALGRPVNEEDAREWLADTRKLPTLFLDEILAASSEAIVHHPGFAAEIESRYRVKPVYIPFATSKVLDDAQLTSGARLRARADLGIAPETVLIISLGFVAPVKGPVECIYALGELHDWNLKAELHFVGEVHETYRASLEEIAENCDVKGSVVFTTDFVSEAKYRQYLLAADFAIQPRKVGFGQGSGAIAECAAVGLVTVASENVANSVEAPDFVLRVPDGLSPTLIAERILEAYELGMHHSRLSPARTEYLQRHSFERYAQSLLQNALAHS